ncbi:MULTISPECIES: GntR family transcriptional regulator [Streptomyces]|uniref:GntR family transcriptional regulator n=1 Tax=Streptomyces morookaense TaxID=1970 RepID=A0A7Y7E5D9_STRMO|nr:MULTISPECIES: GntR family transcriptional regulator [Streptomyces]MCC2276863.1 GntR family transcriptional regulator [Streptomyces sp. ET3-23]NVK76199.1 GntR family transcriptional regulator [Streptomyces morookaense]GHF38100.1 GntR family transcriptional regulator [Streptomyces morookaense]
MGDSRPVYLRIADDLRRRIDEGGLAVGDRIPSRSELKRAYAASDQTVDRAVRVLKAAGYAEGQFGRGVFVADRAPLGTLLRSTGAVDTPFAAQIRGYGTAPPTGRPATVLTWEASSAETSAPGPIAERLGIGPGEPVLCTQYEYLANRHPVQLATSWEPLTITAGTDVALPERGPYARRGVRGRLAAIGIRVVRARELVGSRPATTPEAEALGCAAGQCVTVVERTHFDGEDRAVETSDIVVRADRWRLEYTIPFTS